MMQPDVEGEDTKTCPYCAETIKAAAVKCRYCQSDLTSANPVPADAPPPAAPEAPAAAAPPAGLGSGPRRSGPGVPWQLWVPVALLCLALVVLATLAWQERRGLEAEERAANVARAAVTDKVEALLSYRHATFDEDVAAAQRQLTPGFREEYAPTVAEIRKRAVRQRRDQQAEVLAVGVVSSEEDRVRTLVFVNTVSAREDSTQPPRVMQNRVVVDLVRADDGEGWLVDDLSFPSA